MRGLLPGVLVSSLGSGLGLVGCMRDNPAFQSGGATTSVGSSGEGTGSGSASTTDGSGSTGSSTTGQVCTYESLGALHADVLIAGESAVDCGAPFQEWGFIEQYADVSMQTFQRCETKDCIDCAGTFDLVLTGPADTIPRSAPQCVRVTVEKEYLDPQTQECLFSGVVLSRADGSGVVTPMFTGSSRVLEAPQSLSIPGNELVITREAVRRCDCPDCCQGVADEYELEFTLATSMVKLLPTETFETPVADLVYRITNLQSHDALQCGLSDNIDWTFLDVAFLQ